MKKILLCLLVLAVLLPGTFAVAATKTQRPILQKHGALGPTAAQAGDEIAIFGKYLSADTKVTFADGVTATSVREYSGVSENGQAFLQDRIIVVVPAGAKTGRVSVCNADKCIRTHDELLLVPNAQKETRMRVLSQNKPITYALGDVVTVRYELKKWITQTVFVYLQKHHTGLKNPKNDAVSSAVLIGQTLHKKIFRFELASFVNSYIGTGDNMFTIKICSIWCEVSDTSDKYFSITE